MKNLIAVIIISIGLVVFVSPGFAQDKKTPKWDLAFVHDLEKIRSQKKTGGLGYTLSEEEALDEAIKKAMDQKAPPCEAMKLAVDLNFNPYNVITGIFSSGAEIDLNQLCMCATEAGISKSLMAQATNAAVNENMLTRDEIAQAQCLREGLGYTPEDVALREGLGFTPEEVAIDTTPMDTPVKQDFYSSFSPGAAG
ncbi:MAG: hypothetical protein PF503_06570 [Desulfobacula sp.]|jgi:hypothetical protein|nr:hypothetical protein [Desulfobacula sp.]